MALHFTLDETGPYICIHHQQQQVANSAAQQSVVVMKGTEHNFLPDVTRPQFNLLLQAAVFVGTVERMCSIVP
eukprot:5388301-Amphidinium_carterae.1